MVKKFKNLDDLNQYGDKFYTYLYFLLDSESLNFIKNLATKTNVYIFSGVIRNFFLEKNTIRDVDIVFESNIDFTDLLTNVEWKRNSFGGYKLKFKNLNVDIWEIETTWAIKNNPQILIDKFIWSKLPKTSFFNFSAVLYSINDKKFICEKSFLDFLNTRTLKIVHEPNPNPALCIINTFYYSITYGLEISTELKKFIDKHFEHCKNDFLNVQIKHFGEIKYSILQLNLMKESIFKTRKKKAINKPLLVDDLEIQFPEYKLTTNGIKFYPKNLNSPLKSNKRKP